MSESAEHEFKQHNSDHTLSSFLTALINFIKYWNIYSLDALPFWSIEVCHQNDSSQIL